MASKTYTLINAWQGDQVPGIELSAIEAADGAGIITLTDLNRLINLPEVVAFKRRHNIDEDHPEELLYLVEGELTLTDWPTITVTLRDLEDQMNDVEIVNCTPHPITVCGITIPPSGINPRLPEQTRQVDTIASGGVDIPIVETTYGSSAELPDPAPGKYYVVSAKIALAYPDRQDLLMPGKAERDSEGNIIGVSSLARVPR